MKIKIYSALVGLICGGLAYWFQPYNSNEVFGINILLFAGIISLFAVLGLGYNFKRHLSMVTIFYTIGFLVAVLGRIIYDTSIDSSSHNLLPFELGLIMGVTILAALFGGLIIKMIMKKND